MAWIEMKGITKKFGSLIANNSVDFSVNKGEIHCLLGENGAGKTTLMKVLYGMSMPDSGEICIDGKKVEIDSPSKAISMGISMVHQHFMLALPMTVAENITLYCEPKKGLFIDSKKAISEVEELSQKYGLKVDPKAVVSSITIGEKQRVEILKALYRNSDILILDEPTAVLTAGEVDELFEVLKSLRSSGKTIIIITHKLREIMNISDRVTVMRQGEFVCTKETSQTNPEELASLMVGRKVVFEREERKEVSEDAPVVMEMQSGVYRRHKVYHLKDMNFSLRKGEIFGICGVEGNGQSQLIEILTGLKKLRHGKYIVKGEVMPKKLTARKMTDLGIAHIPEDRLTRGLIANATIWENSVLGYHHLEQYQKKGVLNIEAIKKTAQNIIDNFAVKAESINSLISSLSGGNQQKIVIGRALSHNPDIIIAAQPTRGVDIGASNYIHEQLLKLKDEGKSILLISAELEEVLKLSDRVGVMYDGQLIATGNSEDFDERKLGLLMTGYKKEEEA